MIYQQTTQFPNALVDTHLPDLTESEVKMILVILRQTNGWVDKRTGGGKTRDWISHGQFMKKTGLCRRVISKSLQSLVKKDLIQITCRYGNSLNKPEDRKGVTRMYYSFSPRPVRPKAPAVRTFGVNQNEWKPNFTKMAEKVVRATMAGHTEEEIQEGISNYAEYLSVVWDIADRMEREGKEVPTNEEINDLTE